ncbi:hypothetical protein [Aquimarina algiphila]|uniref:hypothetical protein n=1 Tax=Aquimarina algiphila TaxID=2047982 RepID=UPI0024903E87|nr:hypothetical protein [Aquimarina algiphila]
MKLPYYISFLGNSCETEEFYRFCSVINLSSEEDTDASSRWYENSEKGISVYILNGYVHAIHFFSDKHPNFEGCLNELPFELNFGMTKRKVIDQLGEPNEVIGRRIIGKEMGHSGIYRYVIDLCKIAVTFSKDFEELEVLSFESLT